MLEYPWILVTDHNERFLRHVCEGIDQDVDATFVTDERPAFLPDGIVGGFPLRLDVDRAGMGRWVIVMNLEHCNVSTTWNLWDGRRRMSRLRICGSP